jgi:hypothetical protein
MLQALKEETLGYDLFVSTVKQMVRTKLGEGYDIRIYKVIKNNSLELDSLVVLKENLNIAPNIYLLPYYEAYREGTELADIADRLCTVCLHSTMPAMDQNFTYAFEQMKPYIFFRLVSFERNRKLLSDIPHICYLDLAVTFHCLVRNDEEGIGTIRITNEHMKLWDITINDLKDLAVRNTEALFPASIKSMEEVLSGILNEGVFGGPEDDTAEELSLKLLPDSVISSQPKMYILTNQKGINGASCLLYENVIRQFAGQMNTDLYILPSSIHEIILIPGEQSMKKEVFARMVEDVNRTQVAAEEVLSDHVYYYSREKDRIQM